MIIIKLQDGKKRTLALRGNRPIANFFSKPSPIDSEGTGQIKLTWVISD